MPKIGYHIFFASARKGDFMKKRYFALGLVIVMLVASIAAFGSLAFAVEGAEARLTVEDVTYNASGIETAATEASKEDGSLLTLAAKLSALAPDVAKRYTLTLLGDVRLTSPIAISGNENTEVRIALGGYNLTYAGEGAAISLSGSPKVVRVDGGYTARGERGTVTVTGESSSFANVGEGVKLEIRNIDATYAGASFISLLGSEASINESSVTFVGSGASAVILAKDSLASVKYCEVTGGDTLALLDLSSSGGYIEGGKHLLGSLVRTDDTKCDVLSASVDMETVTAFDFGSLNTTAYVLGGNISASSKVASDCVGKSNLAFYYGDGTMIVNELDPSAYGVQSNCSFVKDGERYVLTASSSSTSMSTKAVLGETPVVATHSSFIKAIGNDGIFPIITKTATVPTVGFATLLKDGIVASSVSLAGNDNVSVIVDLNGHTLTWSDTAAKTFPTTGNMHYSFDGANADGVRGRMVSNSENMMFFYPRQTSDTGVVNEFHITTITNVDFEISNMGKASSNPFININSGDAFIENVTVTYTGAKLGSGAGTSVRLMGFDHSAGPLVRAHLKNIDIVNTDTSGMAVYAIVCSTSARVYAEDLTYESVYYAANISDSARFAVANLKGNMTNYVFTGGGRADVWGCDVKVSSGAVASTGTVYFHATEAVTRVDCSGNSLLGVWTSDEDYAMVPDDNFVYTLTSGISAPSEIKMPVYFADGMILQRGKTINVFGFIDDLDAELKVTLGDRAGIGKPDETGRFEIALDPIDEPTWGLTLAIEQTNHALENKISFSNVNIGELWVISGQSNAQLQIGYIEDVDELAALADTYNNIYTYRANAGYSISPNKIGSASWYQVASKQVKSTGSTALSAVGYAVGVKLAAELGEDVPIGIIHVARGSSKIKTWLDYETLLEVSPSEAKKYEDCVAKGTLPDNAHTKIGTVLYNQQIHPLTGLEVAGVVWYQGCGDANGEALGTDGATYTDYFTALEGLYRRTFGNDDELPFYVMQLAPYTQDSAGSAGVLAKFKAEQFSMCQKLDNTYLVSLANEGGVWGESLFSQGYIHPGRKSPVGFRTGDMILENEYGRELGIISAPMPTSALTVGDAVVITFDTDIELLFGDTVMGFEIKSGSTWYDAEGVIDGNKITLTAPGAVAPTEVRYGFSYITAELEDGTLIPFLSGGAKLDKTNKIITFTYNGETYVVDEANENIRSIDFGNITNASGIPMPVFSLVCD